MYLRFINTWMYLQCSCCHSNKVVRVREKGSCVCVVIVSYAYCLGATVTAYRVAFLSEWTVFYVCCVKPVIWLPWVRDILRPGGGTDMRCQIVILSLSVFWTFAPNDVPLELLEVHELKRCFYMMGQTLMRCCRGRSVTGRDNFVVISCGLSHRISMSGRHRGWAAGRPWRGRPVAQRSRCSLHMPQPPPLHSSAERPESLCWQRSLWWGRIQLHTGHRLLGYAVHCGPWRRQEWLDDPGKSREKNEEPSE